MSNILILSQNYVFNGLGTLTYTVPASILNGPAVSNVPFSLRCQTTIPEYPATGDGGGSGSGYGAGAGGGDIVGFAAGGSGVGNGGIGQGFGAVPNNYKQPIADVHVPPSSPAVSSALSIVVNQNGSPVYTAPALTPTDLSLKFKTSFLCTAGDVITVVFSSAAAVDNLLNTIKSNVSIDVGDNMANPFQTFSFNGLGTQTISAVNAGPCFIKGKLSLPQLSSGVGPSACVVTISQNSTPIYTGLAGAEGFYIDNIVTAVGDAIAITLASSAAADLPLNVIKGTGSLGLGN